MNWRAQKKERKDENLRAWNDGGLASWRGRSRNPYPAGIRREYWRRGYWSTIDEHDWRYEPPSGYRMTTNGIVSID